MASVTGMTAEAIDELMDDMIVSWRIDENGQIITETRGGVETNIGPIIAPSVALDKAHPVGSLHFSILPTNPHDTIGIGTWARYGQGKMLVSQLDGDPDFGAAGATGGEKTVTLTEAQMPSHTHGIVHTHDLAASFNFNAAGVGAGPDRISAWAFGSTGDVDRAGITGPPSSLVSGAKGGGTAHNNLPPFITVYVWRRTA